jgi:hypothetical protein
MNGQRPEHIEFWLVGRLSNQESKGIVSSDEVKILWMNWMTNAVLLCVEKEGHLARKRVDMKGIIIPSLQKVCCHHQQLKNTESTYLWANQVIIRS